MLVVIKQAVVVAWEQKKFVTNLLCFVLKTLHLAFFHFFRVGRPAPNSNNCGYLASLFFHFTCFFSFHAQVFSLASGLSIAGGLCAQDN
jgi:hypothetical protein